MTTTFRFRSNIWKFYLTAFLGGVAFFYNAIDTLYYRHWGLSFQQIGWLISAGLLTSVALEIPSGAFADLHGKKRSILIGAGFNLAGTSCLAFGSSFPVFFAGFVCWGISMAFESGAGSAWLYDLLQAAGRQEHFGRHLGQLSAVFISVDILSGALGPLLFGLNVRLPYLISWGAALLVVPIRLTIHEGRRVRREPAHFLRDSLRQSRDSLILLWRSPALLWLAGFGLLLHITAKTMGEMLGSPFLIGIGYSLVNLSVIGLVGSAIQAGVTFFSDRIRSRLGHRRAFAGIAIGFPLAITAFALTRTVVITAVLSGLFWSLITFGEVIVGSSLSQEVPDDKRATMLSISAMISKTAAVLFLPVFGSAVDRTSMQAGMWMLVLVLAVAGASLLLGRPRRASLADAGSQNSDVGNQR